jgi:type IV secretion system protein VirD4
VSESRPANGTWLIAGALAATTIALLWLLGALSAALFGDGWTTTTAGRLLGVAVRLPSDLGDPRRAWPPPVRGAMPGAVGVYLTLALILGALAGLGVGALKLIGDRARGINLGRRQKQPESARWAKRRDFRDLFVRGPSRGRLILGRGFGRLIAAEERQSVIIFAPTQTHKTVGLAIPILMEWEGPVVATSIKTDLVRDTLARRTELGKVMVFDPARVTNLPRSRATPLSGCETWRGAIQVAHRLTRAAQSGGAGVENANFWYATAEKLLAPLLFAAASSDRPIGDVLRWLEEAEGAIKQVNAALSATKEVAAERAWKASWQREARQRSSIRTTAETIVGAFADPFVAAECASADYTPAKLLNGEANTLYLCAPEVEQERLQPVFSTLIGELLATVNERAAASGKPLDPALLVLLDEAANIAPLSNLAGVASAGAGQGIQLATFFQDFAQVRNCYGDQAQSILNNHRAKLIGTGSADPATLDYVAKVTGLAEFEQRSRTASETGHGSTTEATTYRELAPAHAIREAEQETALLIYHNRPPTRVRLRPHYKERTLIGSQTSGYSNRGKALGT